MAGAANGAAAATATVLRRRMARRSMVRGPFRGDTEAAGTTEAGGGKGPIIARRRGALEDTHHYGPPPYGSRSKAPVGDGQVAERSKARAWKVRIRQKRIVGSNPTLSARGAYSGQNPGRGQPIRLADLGSE